MISPQCALLIHFTKFVVMVENMLGANSFEKRNTIAALWPGVPSQEEKKKETGKSSPRHSIIAGPRTFCERRKSGGKTSRAKIVYRARDEG